MSKVAPPLPDKNTPLVKQVGFEVKETVAEEAGLSTASPSSTQSSEAPRKHKKMYITDFDIKETLGEGSFGAVVAAVEKATGQVCAIKILNKDHIIKEKKEKYVKLERNIMSICNHRNIVSMYKTFSSPENLYYVLEMAGGGELTHHIKRVGSFDVDSAAFYTAEIIEALEHLHQLGIIHRDLKPENILLSRDMHVKLTDFGTAKLLDDEHKANWGSRLRTNSFVGTAEYVAPELLEDRETCRASDLFALGSIVFQMLAGRPPFKAKTEFLTMEKVKELSVDFPEGFPETGQSLVSALLQREPEKRLGAGSLAAYAELRAHPFFESIEWSALATKEPPVIKASGLKERWVAAERAAAIQRGQVLEDDVTELPIASAEEQDKWAQHLFEGERIVKCGLVQKYKGVSVKKRQLILTDRPRLLYVDTSKNTVKGEIPWSAGEMFAVAKNASSFYITTPDRKYILQDKWHKDAEGWVRAIEMVKNYQHSARS